MSHAEERNSSLTTKHTPLSFWQKTICRWAGRLKAGRLSLRFPNGAERQFAGSEAGPSAVIQINKARAVRRLLIGGDLGFAKSYLDGDWETPDLGAVMELALANEEALASVIRANPVASLVAFVRHRLRHNSRSGSRRNIAYHYDLGNEFYRTWLDDTMTYSSALYDQPETLLSEAQTAKYSRIIRELGIGAEDHVLEIGCGWGGFAEQAIRETGCRVTGLTLSREQAAFARERLEKAGMTERADIRLEDYRDCRGEFSKIVSIEMFEAVGEEHWPTYFGRVRELLKPAGQAMVQVITIAGDRFDAYRRDADYIQTYIFPGGMLPSIEAFKSTAERARLKIADAFGFGRDYDRTLIAWDKSFRANWQKIAPLGFDQRFFRMWHYYLHYCAVGFRSGRLDVVQFRLARD
jgi:cyclopropane-fatty-acyl-phospholipid synthase